MYGQTLKLITVAVLLVVAIDAAPDYDDYHDKDCMLDHDGSNAVLEECQDKGYKFVKEYMRILRKGDLKLFGTCPNFHPFQTCITDLWKRCPTVRQVTYPHWKPIVDLMTNACNKTEAIFKYKYHHKLQCLEDEMSSVLVHRCDDMYDFNVEQKTRDKCVFLKEAIQCKTALVNTSCGTEVGEVAYLLSKMNAKKLILKSRCYITMAEPYYGFRYDDNCPRDFKDEIDDCYATHIQPHNLKFEANNDLIISGNKRELREACSGWRGYRNCVRPIKDQCKEGVNLVYQQNGGLRTYLLKMEYICKEEKEVYAEKAPCLQEILVNKSLDVCTPLWNKLTPFLDKVSSYHFYCEPHNINTQNMQQVLESLRMCIERVFSEKCGLDIGSIMSELIRRAFSDPYYLRLDYVPDCSFHKDSSSKKRSRPHIKESTDDYDDHRYISSNSESGLESVANRHKKKRVRYHPKNHQNTNYNKHTSTSLNIGDKISIDLSYSKDSQDPFLRNSRDQHQNVDIDYAKASAVSGAASKCSTQYCSIVIVYYFILFYIFYG